MVYARNVFSLENWFTLTGNVGSNPTLSAFSPDFAAFSLKVSRVGE